MKLSNATRTSDGFAQWTLPEMRELGAQMRRVTDGRSPTLHWAAQLATFVATMKAKRPSYSIMDRTVEDFAVRAGKYVPDRMLLLMDPDLEHGKTTSEVTTERARRTPTLGLQRKAKGKSTATAAESADSDDEPLAAVVRKTRRPTTPKPEEQTKAARGKTVAAATKDVDNASKPRAAVANTRKTRSTSTPGLQEPQKRVTRGQTMTATADVENNEPLIPRRNTKKKAARQIHVARVNKRGRKRSAESDGDTSYHDPTSEEDGDEFWDAALQLSESEEGSAPATQEITSQGESLPQGKVVSDRSSLPMNTTQKNQWSSSAPNGGGGSLGQDPPTEVQPLPRQGPSVEQPTSSHQEPPAEPPREDHRMQNQPPPHRNVADHALMTNGSGHTETPTRPPNRKCRRTQSSNRATDGPVSSSNAAAPQVVRSLNPYDRPGKPWAEFVVEVLVAERTARNEDELDYVQFVRGLYEI
ncbi:unnamed protein product [Phytophthora fragariaefolia]|uniref:Unnamed protein product n=1 Tax=Phytophthora fragariaefolia TaxID=1490495 RepID=A0A9W6U916_9STRA|nr:unnamed protein product [Phytophthora fragariaefolia]